VLVSSLLVETANEPGAAFVSALDEDAFRFDVLVSKILIDITNDAGIIVASTFDQRGLDFNMLVLYFFADVPAVGSGVVASTLVDSRFVSVLISSFFIDAMNDAMCVLVSVLDKTRLGSLEDPEGELVGLCWASRA
jgi:hypothetical protein